MVLRTQNNLDIGPAQRGMAIAAELSVEAARARARGVEGLLGGIASGIRGATARSDEKRREAESSRRFDTEISERRAARAESAAERATDNERAERFHKDSIDHQNAAMNLSIAQIAERDLVAAVQANDEVAFRSATSRKAAAEANLAMYAKTPHGYAKAVEMGFLKPADGSCEGGTCTLPTRGSAPMAGGKTDFERDLPGMAGDDKAREDLGYRPDGSRQPRWDAAPPAKTDYLGKAGISAPPTSPIAPTAKAPSVTGSGLDAEIELVAAAKSRLDRIQDELKKVRSIDRKRALDREETTATADLRRAEVAFELSRAKYAKDGAAAVALATEKRKEHEARVSSVNEMRVKMRSYGIKPTSEQMKAMESDLSNPNLMLKDPDAFIESHFPGARSAWEAKNAKPSADKRTPEEQARYEADLEEARKKVGSPKASKPEKPEKPDDTLSKAEDDADKAALALAEEDERGAYNAIEALGDKTDSAEYNALVKAHDAATAKVREAKQGMVSRAEFRRIEAATRSEMGDEERSMFDRLTPSQKREYVAALRERKARSR